MANTRGSEWRRWDLHLHTKYTHLNNMYNPVSEDDYIKKIIDNGISVVGLTNYFNFSKEDYALKSKLEDKGIVVFLNLELRLTYQNKEDQCCDIHIIFDNDLDTTVIDRFLNNLDVKIDGDEKKANELHSEYDYTNATVEFNTLLKVLNKPAQGLLNHHLIGFLSRGHGNGRTSTQYEQLAKNCHFLIHSSNNSRNVTDDRKFWLVYGKPLLQSSDAHSIDSIGTKFTWIKADTTFEGLKQILYEPEERVRIQEADPTLDYDKSPFTEIEILDNVKVFAKDNDNIVFAKNTIPLNSGLVSIIGGRGTGKSKLIDYIANGLGKGVKSYGQYSRSEYIYVKRKASLLDEKEFVLKLAEENNLPFIYICQGEIEKIVGENYILSKKILNLIGITEKNAFTNEKEEQFSEVVSSLFKNMQILFDDKSSKQIEKINSQITKYENMISNIIPVNCKSKFNKYQDELEQLNYLNSTLLDAHNFLEELDKMKRNVDSEIQFTHLFAEYFNIKTENSTTNFRISPINFNDTIKDVKDFISLLEQKGKALNDSIYYTISDIINDRKQSQPKYDGNLSFLFDNIKKYQEIIKTLKENKDTIIKAEKDMRALFEQHIATFGNEITNIIETYKLKISNKWRVFFEGPDNVSKEHKLLLKKILGGDTDNIDIQTNMIFDQIGLYNKVEQMSIVSYPFLMDKENGNGVFHSYQSSLWKIIDGLTDWNSYLDFIKKVDYNDILTNPYYLELFYDLKSFISFDVVITSNNKPLSQLSFGQRGSIYLRLQLAANLFSETIIYDQPEDDLDNEFITEHLVDLFKEIKKYRQVIIVSHNANLVVNADSEQVIVASNNDGVLSYKSGSLEDPEINKEICRILEGGRRAFEKREQKYGFQS